MPKKVWQEFFYVLKYEKMSNKGFRARIGLSIVTLIVCCVIFCSTTFAWFTSQKSSTVSPVIAAKYFLSIEADGKVLDTKEYTCPLATEDCHVFTMTASGTATTGYCEIKVGDQTYTTVAVLKGQSITLTIVAAQGTQISFSPQWGTATSEPIGERFEISQTPYQIYKVVENVTLEQIAEYYKVLADDILLYNGVSEITVGAEIKIPNTLVSEPMVLVEKKTEEITEPVKQKKLEYQE